MYSIFEKRLLMLKPKEIVISKSVIRESIDEYELSLLADSISVNGIIEPLTVRKNIDGKYELISGVRRYKAARMAGIRRIPCVLHKIDDRTAAIFSLSENMQRVKLNFYEEAMAINSIMKDYGLSESEAAARLGISRSALLRKSAFLKLEPELIKRIISSGLGEGYARQLMRVIPAKRNELLDYIIAQGLTLRQTEEHITKSLKDELKAATERQEAKPLRKAAIGDERLFENSLSKLTTTLKNTGFNVTLKRNENNKFIEYKVRIKRELPVDKATQMGVVGL